TATPDGGSTFGSWSGSCAGPSTSCTVTMSAARSVTATFNVQRFTLSVTPAGTGSGSVSSNDGAISCPGTCSASYTSGTTVILTATPAGGSTFGGWSGSCAGSSTSCTVTMSGARSVTATFNVQRFTLSVNPAGTGSGSVSSNDGAISCPGTCSASYTSGTTVILTATPAGGSTFTGWSGSCAGPRTSCHVTTRASRSVTATFKDRKSVV